MRRVQETRIKGVGDRNKAQDRVHRAARKAGHPLFSDPYEEEVA